MREKITTIQNKKSKSNSTGLLKYSSLNSRWFYLNLTLLVTKKQTTCCSKPEPSCTVGKTQNGKKEAQGN
jgi:hypothetical protein